jgi:hypothetical protein
MWGPAVSPPSPTVADAVRLAPSRPLLRRLRCLSRPPSPRRPRRGVLPPPLRLRRRQGARPRAPRASRRSAHLRPLLLGLRSSFGASPSPQDWSPYVAALVLPIRCVFPRPASPVSAVKLATPLAPPPWARNTPLPSSDFITRRVPSQRSSFRLCRARAAHPTHPTPRPRIACLAVATSSRRCNIRGSRLRLAFSSLLSPAAATGHQPLPPAAAASRCHQPLPRPVPGRLASAVRAFALRFHPSFPPQPSPPPAAPSSSSTRRPTSPATSRLSGSRRASRFHPVSMGQSLPLPDRRQPPAATPDLASLPANRPSAPLGSRPRLAFSSLLSIQSSTRRPARPGRAHTPARPSPPALRACVSNPPCQRSPRRRCCRVRRPDQRPSAGSRRRPVVFICPPNPAQPRPVGPRASRVSCGFIRRPASAALAASAPHAAAPFVALSRLPSPPAPRRADGPAGPLAAA